MFSLFLKKKSNWSSSLTGHDNYTQALGVVLLLSYSRWLYMKCICAHYQGNMQLFHLCEFIFIQLE